MPHLTHTDLEMLCARLSSSGDPDERRVWADECRWAFARYEWQTRDAAEYWHGWTRRTEGK